MATLGSDNKFITGEDISLLSGKIRNKINREYYDSDSFVGSEEDCSSIAQALLALNHHMDSSPVSQRLSMNAAMLMFVRTTAFTEALSSLKDEFDIVPGPKWKEMVRPIGMLIIPHLNELIGNEEEYENGLLSYALVESSVHYLLHFYSITAAKKEVTRILEKYRLQLKEQVLASDLS